MTAEFISNRTGEVSVAVSTEAKQLNTMRISDYTPDYRQTSSVGKRKLMTPDEVLRLPLDQALIILRGQKVLKVEKFDYTLHPESSKIKVCRACEHVPEWRKAPEKEDEDMTHLLKPKAKEKKKRVKKKPETEAVSAEADVEWPEDFMMEEDWAIVATDKKSIMS